MTQTTRYLACLVMLGFASLLIPLRLVQVSGRSMEPTLHPGQRLLLDRLYYRSSGLSFDDIVVVMHNGEEIVKRVKGLPGDQLQMDELSDGTAFRVVNLTRHPELRRPPIYYRHEEVVPPGMIYLIGDNLGLSEDSRRFGPVSQGSVMGVVRNFRFARNIPPPQRAPVTRPPMPPFGRRVGRAG
jgi:signal peptidase I